MVVAVFVPTTSSSTISFAPSITRPEDLIGLGTTDDQRQVLILVVEPVKQGQLLLAVTGVVGGIEVQRDPGGWVIEGANEIVDEEVVHPKARIDVNAIHES